MASCLGIFFFFAGLTGIYSVFTIRKVPVKARGSITIPCLYDSSYRDHVKYLCAGDSWRSCVYEVLTKKLESSGKFSISDDRAKSIFTVTIKDLKVDDSYFWCIVERNGVDAGEQFQLLVTENAPTLSVSDQEVNGSNGQSVTIGCHHTSGVVQWCKLGKLGSSCVKEQSGSIGEARVKIDASVPGVSMVTMSGLVPNSSDWYWCDTGDLQVPVRVNMKEKVQRTTPTPQVTTSLLIPLGLLTFLVMATFLIWYILKRRKQSQEESRDTTRGSDAGCDDGVIYSTVVNNKPQTMHETKAKEDEDGMYSTAEPAENCDGVIYSRVAPN